MVLAACAPTVGTSIAPTPVPFIAAATPSPTTTTPTPTSTPPPMVLTGSFPLIAIGGSHISGLVQVTDRGGSFVADLSVRGLPARMLTVHTVHIHAGSCANPYGGIHLTVLGLIRADSTGAGMLAAPLAPVYVANGRYVTALA